MGQKTNPNANRLYINRAPQSIGCTDDKKRYVRDLQADIALRKKITSKYPGIEKVLIERTANDAHVIIYCAKPGVIIGKKGADAENMKKAHSEEYLKFPNSRKIIEEYDKVFK